MRKATSVGRLLITLIALLALCVLPGISASADPDPAGTVSLDVGAAEGIQTSATFYRGEEFTAVLQIEDAQDIRGYEFSMDFDPDMLQVDDVGDTGFLGITGRTVIPLGPDFEDGTVTFGAISHDATTEGPDAPGPLAFIDLSAVGIGESDLHLHDVKWNTVAGSLEVTDLTSDLPDWTADVGEIFHVTAEVRNTGDVAALGVSATLEQTGGTGSATCTGPVPERKWKLVPDESAEFVWTCECTSAGDFEYTATPTGRQEEIPDVVDGQVTSRLEVGIDFAPFAPPWENYTNWAHLEEPAPEEKWASFGFTETVNVVILGALDLGRYRFEMDFDPNVVDVLDVEDGPFLGSTGRTVVPLGPDITYEDSITGTVAFEAISYGAEPGPDGNGVLATITLETSGLGDSLLNLHDVGVSNTAAESETPNFVVDGTAYVQEPAQLEVTDVSSDLTDDTAWVGQTFHITATVHNAGEAFAEDVSASMEQTGGEGSATCTGPVPDSVATLAGCESAEFVWTCECTGVGDVQYTVTPSGTDANTGEPIPSENIYTGTITIHQEEAAFRIYLPLIMKNYGP